MINFFKKKTGFLIYMLCAGAAFPCDQRLLESYADSMVESICSHRSVSINQIQGCMDFLDYSDDHAAPSDTFMMKENEIDDCVNQNMKTFLLNCQEIFESNRDIDPIMQRSAQLLAERVFQKYTDHVLLSASIRNLLPTFSNHPEDEKKTQTAPQQKITQLMKDLQPNHQKQLQDILASITTNFFPDVEKGNLSLKDLSLKCGCSLERLSNQYRAYLESQ